MISERTVPPEITSALTMIEPGILLVQIGQYGMTHPQPTQPFEYTRAILKSLLWEEEEIAFYLEAVQAMGAQDDRSLVLNVLQPLSRALRDATQKTLSEIAAHK